MISGQWSVATAHSLEPIAISMPVYLPTAITGNSRLLVTLGASGEIMGLFYPWIDFPQNVYECMMAFHFPGRTPHFCWTFQRCWERKQSYVDDSSPCVRTHLTHRDPSLALTITDLVLPDEEAFVREFEAELSGIPAHLYQYFDLALGEVQSKDSVRYVEELGVMVQYWRDLCFVVGGDRSDQFQCGQVGRASSAKEDMQDGRLQGNIQDIGNVNFALGWQLPSSAAGGEARRRPLRRRFLIACGRSEEEARERFLRVSRVPTQELVQSCVDKWSASATTVPQFQEEDTRLAPIYQRAVSSLYLLRDARGGAFLAAPEFDPNFEQSGGYGYCWPRDASEAALTLLKIGDLAPLEQFFAWCKAAQASAGHWNQRYWLWGKVAPAWCLFEDFNQIDQTASVLFAFACWWRALDARHKARAWRKFGGMVSRGANFLVKATSASGLHRSATDLWESFRGSFTYSNTAICAALKAVSQVAEEMDAPRRAKRWARAAGRTRQAIMERLWTGTSFARGITNDGELDNTPDSSILGLIDPFGVLDLSDQSDREKAESMVKSLEAALKTQLPGGPALKRFANDPYLGGSVSAVSTLWLARVLLLLAKEGYDSQHQDSGDSTPQAASLKPQAALESALAYIKTVAHHTTETGLLPEMIGVPPGPPYWAAPHLWASASYIMACFYLQEAREALQRRG